MTTRSFLVFVAGVALALAIPAMGQNFQMSFPDVPDSASFSTDINAMVNAGVIRGYDNGRFGPNDYVTRAQVAVMFNRYDHTVVDPLRRQIAAINVQLGLSGFQCSDGHIPGDAYRSPDGCNSCSCTANGEICTLRACASSSSSSRSSRSSAPVCGNGICESGEATSCPVSCAPGMVCPQYCLAGSCQRDCGSSSSSSRNNQCAPYVCNDGTVIASCTVDGHVINYFVAPCYTHGGEVGQ